MGGTNLQSYRTGGKDHPPHPTITGSELPRLLYSPPDSKKRSRYVFYTAEKCIMKADIRQGARRGQKRSTLFQWAVFAGLALGGAALLAALASARPAAPGRRMPPNLVLITLDTTRA